MKVEEFIKGYVTETEKIRIIKTYSTQFEGNTEELYRMDQSSKDVLLSAEVSIVAASNDGFLCISCR